MKVAIATNNFFSSISRAFIGECDNVDISLYLRNPNPDEYDLVVFSGGADINPSLYGEKNRYSNFNPHRDSIEIKIFREAMKSNTKILGICRGHQLINALLGGYLVQDINIQLGWNHGGKHDIKILEKDSIVADVFKKNPWVNSIHHQGVTNIGKNLLATSFYGGVVESTENEKIVSVQWHPEWMEDVGFFSRIQKWVEDENV